MVGQVVKVGMNKAEVQTILVVSEEAEELLVHVVLLVLEAAEDIPVVALVVDVVMQWAVAVAHTTLVLIIIVQHH